MANLQTKNSGPVSEQTLWMELKIYNDRLAAEQYCRWQAEPTSIPALTTLQTLKIKK